jgi:hypothetical protein
VPAADRERDHAWHVVGVVVVGAGNDLRHEFGASVQCDPRLRVVVDLAFPAVGGADGGDVVPARHEPILHEPAGEPHQPVGVLGGDNYLYALVAHWPILLCRVRRSFMSDIIVVGVRQRGLHHETGPSTALVGDVPADQRFGIDVRSSTRISTVIEWP